MLDTSTRQQQPPQTNSATLKMEAVCSSEIAEQIHYNKRCKKNHRTIISITSTAKTGKLDIN
jgi:hypothetical protein